MNGIERLAAMKKRCGLSEEDEVGVWASFGQNAIFKEAPSGGRSIALVANTDDIDLDEEVVLPQGAVLTFWEKNRLKMFADHYYGITDVAGFVRRDSLKLFPDIKVPRGWKMVAGLLKDSETANAVAALAEETGGIGVSVGFRALKSRPGDVNDMRNGAIPDRVITEWLWLETSFTAMPCNVSCQGVLVDGPGKMLGELDRLVVKGSITRQAATMLGLPETGKAKTPEALKQQKPKRTVLWVE